MGRSDVTKQMPYDLEAEKSVLGSVLLDEKAIYAARSVLSSEDFYVEGHRLIFESMLQLTMEQKPVDLVLLRSRLEQQMCLEKVGGTVYLCSLTDGLPRALNVPYYAKVIRDRAILRRMIHLSDELQARAFSKQEKPEEIVARAQKELFAILLGKDTGGFYAACDLVHQVYHEIELRSERKQEVTGIPSGFADLDRLTRGFQPSDYIVLAARPGIGKTTLALNIATHAALTRKCKVGIFSLEMSKKQLMERMIAAESQVSASRIGTGYLNKDDWACLAAASGALSEAPIYINEESSLEIGRLFAQAHMLKNQHGLDMLIIDYLQLMRSGMRYDNRTHEVSQISAAMKKLAKDLNIPVIALCQLKRAIEASNREPQLSDLRESGSIEQDADLVMFVHKTVGAEGAENYELFLKKQRNGPTGSVVLLFQKTYSKFINGTKRQEGK